MSDLYLPNAQRNHENKMENETNEIENEKGIFDPTPTFCVSYAWL